MFGYEEICDGCVRKCTITSVDESELMYINLDDFNILFNNTYAKEKLFRHFERVDQDKIKESITQHDIVKK